MKLYPRLASCLTLALICTGAMAASQFQPVKDREYREYVNPNNPVAGKAVVGAVVLAAAPDATKQTLLSVFIPKAMSGQLHLEISSADGRFRGEGTYQGNSQGNEWVTLPLTSATDNQRPADASALAVSVSDGSSASIYVTNWGAPPGGAQAQTLRVFVNSRRGEMYWSAGSGAAQRCASLGAAVPVRFDSVCDVPLAQLAKGASLRLVRRDGFDTESQTLTIAY